MPRSCNTGLCLPEEVVPGRELHQPEHDPGGRVRDGAAADDAAGAGGVRDRRGQGQQQRRHAAAAPHRAHRHRGAPRLHPLHRFTLNTVWSYIQLLTTFRLKAPASILRGASVLR